MSDDIALTAVTREEAGSGAVRRLRVGGQLPGVVGTIDGKSISVKFSTHDFERILHHHAGEHLVVKLAIDGKKPRNVLMKEVQHNPLTGGPLHVDFLEVSMTEKMRVSVPVTLVGEPVGVKQDGGVLEHMVRDIEVECLPGDLVEQIVADVSELEIGSSLLVSDLVVDAKLEVQTAGDIAVAAVAAPRVELEPAEEEEGEEGEPALVGEEGEQKEGEGEGGDGES